MSAIYKVGDTVFFGRANGEKTRGKITKINPSRYRIEQMENRGGHPVGTVWNVPPSLVYPTGAPAASSAHSSTLTNLRVGDRVEFTHAGRVIGGTVKSLNKHTVTLCDTSDRHPVGWRVGPLNLRKSDVPAPTTHSIKVGALVKVSDTVDGDALCVVTGVRSDGRIEVFPWRSLSFGIDHTRAAVMSENPAQTHREDLMRIIATAYNSLEPENLMCDGELPRNLVRRRYNELNRILGLLFKIVGRKVPESEVLGITDPR